MGNVIEAVLSNATVTSAGTHTYRAGSAPEVVLVYNVSGPFTSGTSIFFQMEQVDPADETSPIGDASISEVISLPAVGTITLKLISSTTVKVRWNLIGTSLPGVTASVFKQEVPSQQVVNLANDLGLPYSSVLRNNTVALSVESRPLEGLLSRILDELVVIRRQLATITDEDDPL